MYRQSTGPVTRPVRLNDPIAYQQGQSMRNGHYGSYGGQYVAETLMPALNDLARVFAEAREDPVFKQEWF